MDNECEIRKKDSLLKMLNRKRRKKVRIRKRRSKKRIEIEGERLILHVLFLICHNNKLHKLFHFVIYVGLLKC